MNPAGVQTLVPLPHGETKMTSYMEGLLRDIFQAEGAPNAGRLAKLAMRVINNDERNAKIYELRTAEALPVTVIAQRFGISRQMCHRIIREELILRRAG